MSSHLALGCANNCLEMISDHFHVVLGKTSKSKAKLFLLYFQILKNENNKRIGVKSYCFLKQTPIVYV